MFAIGSAAETATISFTGSPAVFIAVFLAIVVGAVLTVWGVAAIASKRNLSARGEIGPTGGSGGVNIGTDE